MRPLDPPSLALSEPLPIEPHELVRRAMEGCEHSFARLADQFRPRLIHLLRAQNRGLHEEAEDIAQESLTRAYQHLGKYNPHFRFSTWLYTIATRLARDHYRRQRRQPKWVPLSAAAQAAVPSKIPSVQHREEANNIWNTARAVLSVDQYTAMWLRFAEELTCAEIAQVMQRSQISVRVLLHRARERLISELNHHTPVASPPLT